jgi:hypothetical protein
MSEERILFEAPKLALTRVEAADALNVSPATLDRLLNVVLFVLRGRCGDRCLRLQKLKGFCVKHPLLSSREVRNRGWSMK